MDYWKNKVTNEQNLLLVLPATRSHLDFFLQMTKHEKERNFSQIAWKTTRDGLIDLIRSLVHNLSSIDKAIETVSTHKIEAHLVPHLISVSKRISIHNQTALLLSFLNAHPQRPMQIYRLFLSVITEYFEYVFNTGRRDDN